MKILHSKIEGKGQPLLIFHGFMGMLDNWKSLGTLYANEGFEVHSIDLRNHGKSFHDKAHNYEVMTQDVIYYINHYQLKNCNIIGHSMGGKLAQFVCCSNSSFFDKIIVADIGVKYYPQHHQTILKGLQAIDFEIHNTRKQVEDVLEKYIDDFGTLQFLLKNVYWKTPEQLGFRFNLETFIHEIEHIGTALPIDYQYHGKTLFINGGNSDYVLEADKPSILAHFPNAKFETIPNVGHWLHAENPKLFFEITNNFLKNE
jgi:esterase